MTSKLIQIGNSQGLRIPKSLIMKYKLNNELVLIETDNGILIQSTSPRHNWRELIQREGSNNSIEGENELIETEFDKNEWTW